MEKKLYFITADIHGFYDELQEALTKAGFDITNPNHIFVSLGDILDRGPQPRQCLQFVNKLAPDRKILIRGNHEDLLEEAVKRGDYQSYDFSNGTYLTILIMGKTLDDILDDEDYKAYRESLVDYFEDDHFVFVHGWIPVNIEYKGILYEYQRYDYMEDWRSADSELWKSARWHNGMKVWADGVREPGKTICCGHWHTSWGNHYLHNGDKEDFSPFIDDGIIALDACTVYSHKVNCVVVNADTGEIMYK